MSVPYVQDTDRWVSYFMNMAERKILDRRKAYVTKSGRVLYPVETETIFYHSKPPEPTDNIKVKLVSPYERASDINKIEVEEERQERKEDGLPPLPTVNIKVKGRTKSVIRTPAVKRAPYTAGDQLSPKKRK